MKNSLNSRHQQQLQGSTHDLSSNGGCGDVSSPRELLEPPLEERIEDLRHRLRIEAAVVEGAKNVIRTLQSGSKDKTDKKALQEVSANLILYIHSIPSTYFTLFHHMPSYNLSRVSLKRFQSVDSSRRYIIRLVEI